MHRLLLASLLSSMLTVGRAQSPDLAAALQTLEGYRPTKAAPTDASVIAAHEQLSKALPRLLRRGKDPVALRLLELVAARRDALVPTKNSACHERDPLARLLVRCLDEQLQQTPAAQVAAESAAAAFPGMPAADAQPVKRQFTIDLRVNGRHSLGLYAPPGAMITVRAADAPAANKLRVRIGAHSDNITRRPKWPRLPRISRTFPLAAGQTEAACAFGGLVYVEVGAAATGDALVPLQVEVEGAVEAPLFVLGETDVTAWRERLRLAPGPWAELATDKVILTVPSERVRGLDDPTAVLQFWNRVLDGAATLAARPLPRQRPERYVADLEISAGAMHSGYPIMTHLDAAADMVDLQRMQKGPWGLFHELGHNHQQKDWTFAGTTEVTVNLFSLYLCETLCGMGPERAWGGNVVRAKPRLTRHLAAGTSPWDGDGGKADLSLRLLMYHQLQREFGWETFTKVFAEYRDLPKEQRPADDDARRDQWLLRFSRATGRNLGPFFERWGLPTSAAARAEVAALPAWLPDGMTPPR
ncbi:MAG: hypothetical protein H6838_05535 [Planctomycetes bacterium]|nr:hypothetical protein [Planctomycetota bacterium]